MEMKFLGFTNKFVCFSYLYKNIYKYEQYNYIVSFVEENMHVRHN